MDKAVKKYKMRRAERLGASDMSRYDCVDAYRKRREGRIGSRMDSKKFEESEHPRDESGKFTSGGAKSGGSKAPEKSSAVEKSVKSNSGEKSSGGWRKKAARVKGVSIDRGDAGFEVPVFDKATFTENMGAKKAIARAAAKELVPDIKKALSTEVRDIKRPKVDEGTKEYLRGTVDGVTDEQIDRALSEADKIYKYWEKNEPAITDAVVGAVKGVGGKMFGLDHRRKFDKSLAKKALGDALNPELKLDGDVAKAAAAIKDGARYTAVFEADDFAEGYKRVKGALEKMGIKEYRCKNFWSQYRDQDGSKGKIGEQKSVQCVFETPDGQKFELQFHTPESMAAKEVNHPTYKQKKDPPEKNREFNEPRSLFMRDTSSVVPDPKGVFDIEGHERGKTGYK